MPAQPDFTPRLSRFSRKALPLAISLGLSAISATALANNSATGEMERMVITATQTKHSELSAPASVSVINRTELEALVIDDLASAVRYLQGVNISEGTPYEIGRAHV